MSEEKSTLENAATATHMAIVHLRRAVESLEQSTTVQDVAAVALAQATYALAEEQRTANMIAWTNAGNGSQELRREIQKRLGL